MTLPSTWGFGFCQTHQIDEAPLSPSISRDWKTPERAVVVNVVLEEVPNCVPGLLGSKHI